ncbi:AI-2E family transporter [Patescibacteria group bacterium]|nr:AI-2E family transporter [Patescibacteria group bacterium]
MNDNRVLDISWTSILKVGVAAVSFYILYLVRDILIWFIFALIISILFSPVIDFLHRRRIPRVLSVIIVYVGTFAAVSLFIYSITPIFIYEVQKFSQIFPEYFEKISPSLKALGIQAFVDIESFIGLVNKSLEAIAANILSAAFVIFGGIFSTIFVLTVAIFISLEEKAVERTLSLLFPKKYKAYAFNLWQRSQKKVTGWFLTRVLASLFVGGASYFAFLILDAKYPFSMGLLAGVLNFVPIVGPIITGFLIFILVSLENTLRAIFVLTAFILIQQIENNILTPILTKKFVNIPPVLVLVSLVVGGKLLGFLGALLAIPIAGILFEFIRDFLKERKDYNSSEDEVSGYSRTPRFPTS